VAEDRQLSRGGRSFSALAALVLCAGAAAELATSDAAVGMRLGDFAVGASLCAVARLTYRDDRPAAIAGLLAAAAWFAGTVASAFALAYRGPVVALLLAAPRAGRIGRVEWSLAGCACLSGLLPPGAAEPATAALAALAALVNGRAAARASVGRRHAAFAAAGCLVALAARWAAGAAGAAGTSLLLAGEAVLIASAGVALAASRGVWERPGSAPFVIELSTGGAHPTPVTTRIARALADPGLGIRYELPQGGWVDEGGRSSKPPDGHRSVTRATAPAGGSVALLHSPGAAVDRRLAHASAAAAVLALDGARLDAEVRSRAAEVRASRRRLLTAADGERRVLAERLEQGPLARLRRVRDLVAHHNEAVLAEIDAASAELGALGSGLYPPFIAQGALPEALAEMTRRSPVPTTLEISSELRELADDLQAAIWFLCSEALANVARHSGAARASVSIAVDRTGVTVAIVDDGRGGATTERGLRGLADRIEALGGTLHLDSPPRGPTSVTATLPRSATSSDRRIGSG
jgi:hypothetical protein